MAWKDKIKGFFTRSQSDLPWSQTFRMQMRAPVVANRLFDTKAHMIEYISDQTDKASAFVGMVVSVNHNYDGNDAVIDGSNMDADDGLYLITGVGASANYKRIATGEESQNIIYKTTAEWNIDEKVYLGGTLLVYSDRNCKTTTDPNTGETTTEYYVGIKAGCGKTANQTPWVDSYSVRLNEFKTAQEIVDDLYRHIQDNTMHHKIGVKRDEEVLIFTGNETPMI